jgi:hypothetical protein
MWSFISEQIEKSLDCVVLYQNNSVLLQSRIKKRESFLKVLKRIQPETRTERVDLEIVEIFFKNFNINICTLKKRLYFCSPILKKHLRKR